MDCIGRGKTLSYNQRNTVVGYKMMIFSSRTAPKFRFDLKTDLDLLDCIGKGKSCCGVEFNKTDLDINGIILGGKTLFYYQIIRVDVMFFGAPYNTELNVLRKIVCLKSVCLKKQQQFLMSLKNWWNMAYTVCHASLQMMS